MTLFQAVVSGIVQGITEFFPISSSGHLVLLHGLFGIKEPKIAFDIFLHLGTLVAILIFFHKNIIGLFKEDRRELVLLITASIPTFLIALLFKDSIEKIFGMPKMVGYMLLVTGGWLVISSVVAMRMRTKKNLGILNSIIIGIAQGISIIPGISRSGSTIATGMCLGIEKEKAFSFSFLLAIPAILGAALFKTREISSNILGKDALYFIIGGAVACLTGLFAVKALLKIIKNDLLILFGIYCASAGLLVLYLYRG